MQHPFGTLGALLLGLVMALGAAPPAAADLFPRYEVIAPNVDFWIKVYSRYTTRQSIIHDSVDLTIVYDVIAVKPYDAPGAGNINRERLKRAKAKYENILKRLAADPAVDDEECRRVALLFGPRADAATFRRASRRVRSQLGQMDRFKAGLIRSGAYLDEIRTILKSYGVPEDLAYLPHVESSFNLSAYSKFGAAGIWQFTRSTGRQFMTVDYVMDERRDPIRATHAAARLLSQNHARLGSWPLAVSAYNHGANGMARARQMHGDYPAIFTHYHGRSFKFASRNFYSEFLAAREVAVNYRDYFGPLALDVPTPIHTVELAGYVHIEDLCDHYAISPEIVQEMNPALRPPVFNGQKYIPKGYRLRLPVDSAAGGVTLAALPAALYKTDQKPSRFYTVQRGDTAGRIAQTHGVRLSDLILANNLSSRATIYPEQSLRIPLPGETVAPPASPTPAPPAAAPPVMVAAASEETAAVPAGEGQTAEETPPSPVLAAAPPPPPLQAAFIPVPVQAPPVPAPAVPETPEGQSVPDVPVVPGTEIVAIDVRFAQTDQSAPQPVGVLRVEVEETLGHYADWAGVPTRAIRRLNGLRFGRTLRLHEKIRIPLDKVPAAAFEELRYEYHKQLQEDFFAAYRVAELAPYQVRPGDNYWTLCRHQFDIPLWLLKHYNTEVDLAALRVRQELMVPVIAETSAGQPGTVTDDDAGEGSETLAPTDLEE